MKLDMEAFRKWGAQGGRKAKRQTSPKRRKAIARKAARARWGAKGKTR